MDHRPTSKASRPASYDGRRGRVTARIRAAGRRLWPRDLPNALVIGAQKAGTSSLFTALEHHPAVRSTRTKEPQFFAYNYPRGLGWYRGLCPAARPRLPFSPPPVIVDASTYHLHHPVAAERAHRDLPRAKLLAVLRDPLERSFSQYRHEVRAGREELTFEAALAAEPERLAGEAARLARGDERRHAPHETQSYRTRSDYAPQLQRWIDQFGDDALLVLRAEDLFASPARELHRVQDFLGLEPVELHRRFEARNVGDMSLPAARRRALLTDFEPIYRAIEDRFGITWNDLDPIGGAD